jgi:hypothetical protein
VHVTIASAREKNPMTRRVRPERQIQKAVLGHLAWRAVPDVWWCHYPAGGWRSPIEAAILQSLGVVAGVPDLLLIHRGQLYGLELKAGAGRLTNTQSDMHEKMRRAGAIVATAYGVDAAVTQLVAWGVLRPDASTQVARAFAGLRHDVAERVRARGGSR